LSKFHHKKPLIKKLVSEHHTWPEVAAFIGHANYNSLKNWANANGIRLTDIGKRTGLHWEIGNHPPNGWRSLSPRVKSWPIPAR
jgi:hypothetical protein